MRPYRYSLYLLAILLKISYYNLQKRPEEFFLPEEPLQVPGIQLSRESSSQWTEEEVSRWYVLPSEEDLDGLRSIGENAVENLLEAVP